VSVAFPKFATYFDRHSGQAGVIPAFARRREPESRTSKNRWIPACAGMTKVGHRFC